VETLRRARANEPAALREVSGWLWLPPVPFRIVRTSEGVWTLSEVARGSSTAHLDACAWWNDGRTGFLCGDPGWRKPKDTDYVRPGRAWVDGTTAWAEREGRAPVSMPLPGGTVYCDLSVSLAGVSLAIPGEPAPPPAPEPIGPPGPVPGPAPGKPPRKKDDRKQVAVGVGIAALLGSLLSQWLSRRKGGSE
jgi:hypothetical protein